MVWDKSLVGLGSAVPAVPSHIFLISSRDDPFVFLTFLPLIPFALPFKNASYFQKQKKGENAQKSL